jgi:hypothetical protein
MAIENLNIIGSLTAGTIGAQNQIHADRERAEAYRRQLKQQVLYRTPTGGDPATQVEVVDAGDRMTIGDQPEENRGPRYFSREGRRQNPEPDKLDTPDSEESSPERIDVVI